MGDKIISHNLHGDQEAMETFSLTDIPLAQDHLNLPSSSTVDDVFEFSRGGLSGYSNENMISYAEDIIFCGKLVPINEQILCKRPSQQRSCRRSRSEPRSDVKSLTVSPLTGINNRSVDYKKINRNSSMSFVSAAEPGCEGSTAGSGKNLYSRKHVFLHGLVNVTPPEMNIRDLKNRRVRLNIPKTSSIASSDSLDVFSVSRNVDNRKCSWRVLELLSCKSNSAAVTTSLSYMAKV